MQTAFRPPLLALATLAAGLVVLAGPARADVLVVDLSLDEPVQPAIDAAAPGDTVLVVGFADFEYEREFLVIDGKGLQLIGDTDEFNDNFAILGLRITNLPAGQVVTVKDVFVPFPTNIALELTDNAGAVRLVECTFRGKQGSNANIFGQVARDGKSAAVIENCADVLLRNSSLRGGQGGSIAGSNGIGTSNGGPGMEVSDSRVVFYGASAIGGEGGRVDFLHDFEAGDGGVGCVNVGSQLHLYGSVVRGGEGGENQGGAWESWGLGGDGYIQSGSGSLLTTRQSLVEGGDGVPQLAGSDGEDQQIEGGTTADFPTPLGNVTLNARVVRPGDPLEITTQDVVSDTPLWLLFGLGHGNALLPNRQGSLMVAPPFAGDLVFLGTSPAVSFISTYPLGVGPELPPGLDTLELLFQGVLQWDGMGLVTLGMPEQITLLSSDF